MNEEVKKMNRSMKKFIIIIVVVIICIFISLGIKIKEESDIKKNMLEYISNKYNNNEFTLISGIEEGNFKKKACLDPTSCVTYKYGEYYRYKVRSEKDGIEFYVQYLSKDDVYEDTYWIVLEQNEIAEKIKKKIKEIFSLESTIFIESVYDDPTDMQRFVVSDYNYEAYYTAVVNETLDIYNLQNIQKIFEWRTRKDKSYYSELITFDLQIQFNGFKMGSFSDLHIDKEYPTIKELEKLLEVEKEYAKLSKYNDGYLRYYYNNVSVNFNEENIVIRDKTGNKNYTIREFIQELHNRGIK